MRCKEANSSFAAYNSVVDVVVDGVAGDKVSGRVTDAISTLLEFQSNAVPVRQIVIQTARYKHVVVHVFAGTFVAVKRMELPLGEQLDSQPVDDDADRQQNKHCTGN